ncbi:MAG: GNAT family N-acetyltransferase [Bdellovibrionota bacterium]
MNNNQTNKTLGESIWQPTLTGVQITLRPLEEADFEDLYLAASDPLIWEQHPDRERYTRERFQVYFRSGMESNGAFAVIDIKTQRVIGCSRYFNSKKSSVEMGYTFLTRAYWGKNYNKELKQLMLDYAFRFVEDVYFVVGKENYRSQKAMAKIGASQIPDFSGIRARDELEKSVAFQIKKENWISKLSEGGKK